MRMRMLSRKSRSRSVGLCKALVFGKADNKMIPGLLAHQAALKPFQYRTFHFVLISSRCLITPKGNICSFMFWTMLTSRSRLSSCQ